LCADIFYPHQNYCERTQCCKKKGRMLGDKISFSHVFSLLLIQKHRETGIEIFVRVTLDLQADGEVAVHL
jgi:hypothetical protein